MSTPSNINPNGLCPWQAAIEAYFCEFMQFYYPLAHSEINWHQPVLFLADATTQLQQQIPMAQAPLQSLVQATLNTGQLCHAYVFIGWQPEPNLAEHMAQVQSRANIGQFSPVACFALLSQFPASPEASGFTWNCLGSQLAYHFTCYSLNDYLGQESELIRNDNAFALLTLTHLVKQATYNDMAARYAQKWDLIQSLFQRGWTRQRIINLFLAIDWSLPLPLRWSQQLWRNIEQFEEQQIMRYVSSVERFVRENERQQGYIQGQSNMLQHLLSQRFGELPLWVGMQLQDGNSQQFGLWLERALSVTSLEEVFHEDA